MSIYRITYIGAYLEIYDAIDDDTICDWSNDITYANGWVDDDKLDFSLFIANKHGSHHVTVDDYETICFDFDKSKPMIDSFKEDFKEILEELKNNEIEFEVKVGTIVYCS